MVGKDVKVALPRLVESMLGRGINGLACCYDQTFFTNSEKGYYTDTESDVFRVWKMKLKKYEEKNALMANYTYRNEKRIEK